MSDAFTPTHKIDHVLDGDRSVSVQTDGDRFGIIFRNGDDATRCLLSNEAMKALASSYAPLTAGRGETISYKWHVVADHRAVSGLPA